MSLSLSRAGLRPLPVVLALALAALASVPAAGAAKPPPPPAPQLDTATATGTPSLGVDGIYAATVDIDAHSGPSGESPGGHVVITGQADIRGVVYPVVLSGPVTCLTVTGNTAVITIDGTLVIGDQTFVIDYGPATITLQDNGSAVADRFGFIQGGDCSTPVSTDQLLNGRAQVFDAHPLPTTKTDCMSGGFTQWGFKNQGQCIRFVNQP